jgi:branched-chain amino acid transport system ATP-binding protein
MSDGAMSGGRAVPGPDAGTGGGESAPVLRIDGLTSGYGNMPVLRNVSFSVAPSTVVAVLGPNGAGKTTLLKTVSGLIRPMRGTVWIGGRDATRLSPTQRVRAGLCHIPEGRGIFPSLTVRENIRLQAEAGTEDDVVAKATESFPQLGRRLGQIAGSMSGGEQQMLAMTRAYLRNPAVILVDEASLGLSPALVDQIFEFLHELTRGGAALLVVDQFAHRLLRLAHSAHVLQHGELVFSGAPGLLRDELFERYLGGSFQPSATRQGAGAKARPGRDGEISPGDGVDELDGRGA